MVSDAKESMIEEDIMGEEFKPKHLGKHSSEPVSELDLIPWQGSEITICLDCSEFTSRCPVTGQPDYATFEIEYIPHKVIAETKSVKLYMMGFRERAEFNEALVARIAEEWYDQLKPRYICVTGEFNKRGGISVTAMAEKGER